MALPGVKYDDGSGGFASNCFPVRSLIQTEEEGGGAWLVAHRAEQRRRFKAILCAKPKSYDQIREERKKLSKEENAVVPPPASSVDEEQEEQEEEKVLDGFFLMKHCYVEDPSDLCSVNISGQSLTDVKEEDFGLFDNVAYINASENILPFESFRHFPIVRELEMPLNGLRALKLNIGDFPHLEILDLSYNNLSLDDILILGFLHKLRVLHLTGNNLRHLPKDFARPYIDEESDQKIARFPQLEILMLDDNKLSDVTSFATLAGLKKLKHLNLSKNGIFTVPQLMVVDGRHVTQEIELSTKSRRSRSRSGRSSRRSARKARSRNSPMQDQSDPSLNIDLVKPGSASHVEQSIPESETNLDTETVGTGVGVPQNTERGSLLDEVTEETDAKQEENDDLTELNLGELNLRDLDAQIEKTMELDNEHLEKEQSQHYIVEDDGRLPPPFPELEYLNLSHNKISEEEGLLAVAAWPMLSELVIHDNPLTTHNSGDPPLLKRFLQDRLGIYIVRKKPGPLAKPHVEVQSNPERQVDPTIPKVPKRNIDDIIAAIEAPFRPALPEALSSAETTPRPPTQGKMDPGTPLPPIPGTPTSGRSETASQPGGEDANMAGDMQQETPADTFIGDPFFMTQVDEPEKDKTAKTEVTDKPERNITETKKKKVPTATLR